MSLSESTRDEIDWHFLCVVIIIAFVIRLLYIFTLEMDQFYFDDSSSWNQMALNFLGGKGLIVSPTAMAFRMPIYPIFLSGIYHFFGAANLFAVRIIQAGLSALTCMLIYLISIEVFNERVGKVSLVVSTIYPFFIYYSGAILTETLYMFLLAVFVWFMIRHKYFWASIMLGISVLCRSEISLFIVFIVIGLFFILPRKDALRTSVVILALLCVVISPWVARNYIIFNRFVPLSTVGGIVLWEGNNPQNLTGGPCHYFPDTSGMDEVQRDEYLKSETIKVIRENPKRFMLLCWSKFKRFWNVKLNTDDPRYASSRNNLVSIFSFGPVLLLFIPGLVISFWNRKNLAFLYFLILYVMLINLVFVSSLRYRLPIEPYMIIIASYSFSVLFYNTGRKIPQKN